MGATLITSRQICLPALPEPSDARARMPWPNRAGDGRRETRWRLACALAYACCLEGALVAGAWWLDRPRPHVRLEPPPSSVAVVFVPAPSEAAAETPADIPPVNAPTVAETPPVPEVTPAPPAEPVSKATEVPSAAPTPAVADATFAPPPPTVSAPTATPPEAPNPQAAMSAPLPAPVLSLLSPPRPSAPSRQALSPRSPANARLSPALSPRLAEHPASALPAPLAAVEAPATTPPRPSAGEISTFEGRIRQAVQAALRVPPAVRLMGLSGRTGVVFTYRDGAVDSIAVSRSAGAAMLDGVAVAAVRSARYPRAPENVAGQTLRLLVWVEIASGSDGE